MFFCPAEECPKCASNLGFKFLYSKSRQGIDVDIPAGLSISLFSDFKLVPVDIIIPFIACLGCKDIFRVVPDFVTSGTTLTLAAQALVAVRYHAEKATWRKLNYELCGTNDGIAHTTLYRGYHSFGKNLISMEDKLAVIIAENTPCNLKNEIPRTAQKSHTKKHEAIIISFLLILLLSSTVDLQIFWKNHWRLLEVLTAQSTYAKSFKRNQIYRKSHDTS